MEEILDMLIHEDSNRFEELLLDIFNDNLENLAEKFEYFRRRYVN